jgi:hypothetical protein
MMLKRELAGLARGEVAGEGAEVVDFMIFFVKKKNFNLSIFFFLMLKNMRRSDF